MTAHEEPVDERYLAAHLHEALLADPRVGEQDLEVQIVGGGVRVSGTVATIERREAIPDVIADHAPGCDVRIDVDVVRAGHAAGVEDISP